MSNWSTVLELDNEMAVVNGSELELCKAINQGADLRIATDFIHNEHIDPQSDIDEIVHEVSDFRVTYLVDDNWVAAIQNLRMPINPPVGFHLRPSMSFFMYNQNGSQAIARPFLDGKPICGKLGASPLDDHSDMSKYYQHDAWDSNTNAPSSNFTYNFELMRFIVRNEWQEVFSHSAEGDVISGSFKELTEAFLQGSEIKVAIKGLCADLGSELEHEVFIHAGPGYHNTKRKLFSVGTQPLVRVRPNIPMQYESKNWDMGWLMVRTDGFVARWLCNPYNLKFHKSEMRCAVRWFVS
jgi:hypothetical protein